ncbi:MAG: hypothetical protein IT305_28620 [Chloroflexi bacterium]|nr:hypothetical protein [Chloroflexota bacterium]
MDALIGRLRRALVIGIVLAPLALPALYGGSLNAESGDIDIDEIGRVKRGKERVSVRVEVHDEGLTCQLKVKYADGNADSPDDVQSNSKGVCELLFDVPERRSVVGDAIAKVKVVNKKGKEVGRSSRTFQVRDGRQ